MSISLICEIALLSLSLSISIYSSYTDFKYQVVKNKALLLTLCISLPLLIVYYGFIYRESIFRYLGNVLLCSVISILLYWLKIWGGGDSKLFMLLSLLIPSKLYSNNLSDFPLLEFPIFVFSFGYLFIVFESVIKIVKNNERINLPGKADIVSFINSYLFLSVYMLLFSEIIRLVIPDIYYKNVILFWIVASLLSLLLTNITLFNNKYLFIVVVFLDIILKSNNYVFNPLPYVIVLLLYLTKTAVAKYNYKTIDIDSIKTGDILSAGSVLMFQGSKIDDLPKNMSENLSAKLNDSNIKSIKKWSKTHPNISTITLVSKIPFVIHIMLGYIYFIIIEVLR